MEDARVNVIVGYIESPEGEAALEHGIRETRLREGRLAVVHSMRGGGHDATEDYMASRDALEALRQRLQADGIDHEVMELVRGSSPAEDLLQVAEEIKAAVIVIGLRRRSPVGKLLLGSNAQQVLLRADCPVIAVKAAEA